MVFLGFQAKEFTLEEFESTQQGGAGWFYLRKKCFESGYNGESKSLSIILCIFHFYGPVLDKVLVEMKVLATSRNQAQIKI